MLSLELNDAWRRVWNEFKKKLVWEDTPVEWSLVGRMAMDLGRWGHEKYIYICEKIRQHTGNEECI